MAYSQAWLENPAAVRGLLVEVQVYDVVAANTITMYLSTMGYVTTDSSVSFKPILSVGTQFTETISLDGTTSLSYGDLEINNPNGEYDAWLDPAKYIWVNKSIVVYLGDPFWVCSNLAQIRTDFLKVFDGIVADLDSKSREKVNIKLRDKLQRLNGPVSEDKIGAYGTWSGGQTNQDALKPVVFGEVFNMTPMLVNPVNVAGEYRFNSGASELMIEVRDNGVPLYTSGGVTTGATVTLASGLFTLVKPSAGTITCSVQGINNSINLATGALVTGTYNNNIANLIALIVTQYGNITSRFTASDLDLTNLAAFAAANTQSVGLVLTDRTNVIDACQQLAMSIGAQLYMTRTGKLQLLRLGVPTSDTPVTITDTDIYHHTLSISQKSTVVAATKIGYCKDWTIQEGLVTDIPEAHKKLFSDEWLPKEVSDGTTVTRYTLPATGTQKDTLLIVGSEAAAEATRLNNYFKVPRTVYRFTGRSKLFSLKLGQSVNLAHSRFNLYNGGAGQSGQVISLNPDWLNSKIGIEVII